MKTHLAIAWIILSNVGLSVASDAAPPSSKADAARLSGEDQTTTENRPNFVIMMTDDQRADALSIAGNKILKTPNLDRIGHEGMMFRNMFVTNSLCAPSRATLLTGLYSHTHGVRDNSGKKIPLEIPLLSDHLRKAGYEVAFCGKSHVTQALRDRTWDYYFGYRGQGDYLKPMIAEGTQGKDQPYEGYMDDVITEHAVNFLKKPRQKPFCLFLFFKAPHRSWLRAPRHAGLFKEDTIPIPETYDEGERGYPGKPQAFIDADNKIGNEPDVQSLDFVKDYYATITAVDENVGKVFDALDESNLLEQTALIHTSDNGFFLGEWKLYDKRLMHEPSIRVPLLVRYPKMIKAGTTCDAQVLNIDIAPTVLDLAGIEVPENLHGKSMKPLFSGDQTDWREDWLYEYYEYPAVHMVRKNRGIRTESHKLIHYFEDPEEFELYDLVNDPGERKNLYGRPEYSKLVEKLKQRIMELRRESVDPDLEP